MFLKARKEVVKFCNEQIELGSHNAEALQIEINTTIIPACHEGLQKEIGGNDIPSFDDLLK